MTNTKQEYYQSQSKKWQEVAYHLTDPDNVFSGTKEGERRFFFAINRAREFDALSKGCDKTDKTDLC